MASSLDELCRLEYVLLDRVVSCSWDMIVSVAAAMSTWRDADGGIEGVMSRTERMVLNPNPAQLHMEAKQRDRVIHDPNMST